MRVFLGGTCNGSTWRKTLEIYLDDAGIEYFDPVVEDWDDAAQTNEIREREECDYCLYTITPRMLGYYSIAEVIDDSNKRPDKTIFVILRNDGSRGFSDPQWHSLKAVAKMVKRNGGHVFTTLGYITNWLEGR